MNEPRSKIIISPINNRDWTRTIDTFEKQARKKGVTEEIISDLVDMLDLNHEKILDGINKETASDNSNSKSSLEEHYIRKYSANGRKELHEAVLIGGRPMFVRMDLGNIHMPFKCVDKIETTDKVFFPADTLDTQNPIPYIFDSIEELNQYLELADKETLDSLFKRVENAFRLFVVLEDHSTCDTGR